MGNVLSSGSAGGRANGYVTCESETMSVTSASLDNEDSDTVEEFHDTIDVDDARTKAKEEEMEEFRKQLNVKREQRREILNRHKSEKAELERSLEIERKAKFETYETNRILRELLMKNNIEIPENVQPSKENSDITDTITQMKEEFEKLKSNNNKLRRDLAESNSSLQNAYSDIADLSGQNTESIKQINALKEVITVSKTMINLREQQLNALKNKLNEIERSLSDREASMLSADLRQEYARQLQNIRTLRGLYEERARLSEVTRLGLVRELEEQKILKEAETNKCKNLTAKVEELEAQIDELHEKMENKNIQIASYQDETRSTQAEMAVVNKLFSQVLLGYKTKQDLDKLVHRLEENHGLLTHMAERENGSETSSALPKLLLELVSQVDEREENKNSEEKCTSETSTEDTSKVIDAQSSINTSAEEIVQNLPKVWRVLMELLSHQSTTDENTPEKVSTCYKSVETKSGPVLVPSVSQTYIRLKDLIIEKLALIKEVNNMKQLNGHLETRLKEQEKRLCSVTTELSKTWHVVGRLRRHHHQLHTHEKILKYELQQKRKLLNELKEELEYCREKWEQAREKNSQTEKDFRKLRTEFSNRKTKSSIASFNNSAESGYSDERPSDESSESNDESERVTEPLIRSRKKKFKKSFETILDSSTDFNLTAEREDPASDMLDVADLPLDTQEGEEHQDASISDSCYSENVIKDEKVCVETEDELGDVINEFCVEEPSSSERCDFSEPTCIELIQGKVAIIDSHCEDNDANITHHLCNSTVPEIVSRSPPAIDAAAILKSIAQQKERLAKRDKKLETLEKSGTALLKQIQATSNVSQQIDSTLNHIINRPTSSRQTDGRKESSSNLKADHNNQNNKIEELTNTEIKQYSEKLNDINPAIGTVETSKTDTTYHLIQPTIQEIENKNFATCTDNKCILESMIEQREESTNQDEILQNLATVNPDDVRNIASNLSDKIIEKLKSPCSNSDEQTGGTKLDDTKEDFKVEKDSAPSRDGSEPSTSSDLDHEARFAARDQRLKRLEEQTKSLVTKVNNTTTKGVKIHYKLEELHNIYGSENSRSGTPSEDNEDSQNNETEGQD